MLNASNMTHDEPILRLYCDMEFDLVSIAFHFPITKISLTILFIVTNTPD